MTEQKILSDIDRCIDWYSKNYSKAFITELSDCKSRLGTLLYNYSDEVAETKKDSLMATVFRKYHHHKFKSELIEKKFTASLAETESIKQTFEDLKCEAETESLAYLTKLKLDQANRIIDDIMQRISILKSEKENSKHV